jgi:hypothetical protein
MTDPLPSARKTLVLWPELGYAARWWLPDQNPEHAVEFEVLALTCRTIGPPEDNEPPEFATGSHESEPLLITGFIKWDGCSHWWFEEKYHHLCGRADLAAFTAMLERCWTFTDHIKAFDKEIAR